MHWRLESGQISMQPLGDPRPEARQKRVAHATRPEGDCRMEHSAQHARQAQQEA